MKGWLIVLAIFVAISIVGYFIHKYEESVVGAKINLEEMSTLGSIIFTIGACGSIFSIGIAILCI